MMSDDGEDGPSVAQLIDRAAALHGAGHATDAEALLEAAAQREPTNFAVWFNRAAIALRRSDWARAAMLFGQAAGIDPTRLDVRRYRAEALLNADEPAAAEQELRAHLADKPRDPEALQLMGALMRQTGRLDEAIARFENALECDANCLSAYLNLGRCYADMARYDEAAHAFTQALQRRPASPGAVRDAVTIDALSNLAWSVHMLGDSERALGYCGEALTIDPNAAIVRGNRAAILLQLGRLSEALEEAEQAMACDLKASFARSVYGNVLTHLGRATEAVRVFLDIIAAGDTQPGVLIGLGNAHFAADDTRQAAAAYRSALAQQPDNILAMARLCRALLDSWGADEAENAEEASALAHKALDSGKSLDAGFVEFQTCFQRTADFAGLRRLGPTWRRLTAPTALIQIPMAALHNQLSHVVTPEDRRLLLTLHRRWGERLAAHPAGAPIAMPAIVRSRAKLRLGLISSDLRMHAIAYFALPLVEQYDRESVELYCYSFYPGAPDAVQSHIASRVDSFTLLPNSGLQEAAQRIADDGCDMLVELGGATKYNRIELMAYRMAPVQASWLGYPHSAGLSSIDYILVDPYLKPADPSLLIERPLEMPDSWVCFDYPGFADVALADIPPVDRNGGRIRFGTLNSPYKFTPQVIEAWSRVLQEVPQSQFLIVRPEANSRLFRNNIVAEFARHDIAGDRLLFAGNVRKQHLAAYNEIDIALDTFPQTGGTTTCETIWMGVPVVTLVGECFFERLSYSNLSNAGLGDLCAGTIDDYVARAASLARDLPRLRALRRGLREQVRLSPLGRTERWVRNFESAVRGVGRGSS